jgi:hypothetical protein
MLQCTPAQQQQKKSTILQSSHSVVRNSDKAKKQSLCSAKSAASAEKTQRMRVAQQLGTGG